MCKFFDRFFKELVMELYLKRVLRDQTGTLALFIT